MQSFPRPELLLHPLVPPPLHGLAPRKILGDRWWDDQRHQAMSRNMYRCWACNIPKTKAKKHKWLEGHESYEIDWKNGTCKLIEVVSLCHYCHNYIHKGRLEALLVYGRVEPEFVEDVIRHGDNLTAHLQQPRPVTQMAEWNDWVLLIDGKPYPSRFSDETEWATYYHWINTTGYPDNDINYERFRPIYQQALIQRTALVTA
jgi:hypothetical protein